MAKNIAFLSPTSKGISADLRIIKEYFFKISDASFSFFTANENLESKEDSKAVKLKKVDFCKKAENIVCAEASLPIRNMFENSNYSRVFIPAPYDYLFKRLLTDADEKRNSLSNFTHIFYPSPLAKLAIEKHYSLNAIEIIDGYASPLAYDICKKDKQEEILKKIESIYPGAKGKKIISIFQNGKADGVCEEAIKGFNLGDFLDKLSDDCALFTNMTELLDKTHYLSESQRAKFYYFDLLLPPSQLLYVTDVLITNSSYLACSFAAKRLPIYALQYSESYFEQYMAKESDLTFPSDAEKIANQIASNTFDSNICKLLSYPADKSIFEKLNEILK